MLFNNTIKKEIKKKIFRITKREKQEQSKSQLKDSFDTFSLSFFPKNRKGRARKKKIHKSDTETVFPPSNVPMDSLPGKARANSLKMHTFPPLYDLSFAITIHPFSNFERDNVRGNPVSPLTWTVCTDSADDSALPLPLSPSSSLSLFLSLSLFALTVLTSQKRNRWPNSLQIHPSLPSVSNYLSAHPVQSV